MPRRLLLPAALLLLAVLGACAPLPPPAPEAKPAAPPPKAQAPAEKPAPPTGFAGIHWGDAPTAVSGLTLQDTDTGLSLATYAWPGGPNAMAKAPLRSVLYEFFEGRFYHVWIDYDGYPAYRAILAELTSRFGPPTEEKPEAHYHAWFLGDVNIYCVFHQAEAGGDVSFFYQPLYERLEARRKAQPKAPPAPAPAAKSPKGKKP